MLLLLLYIFYFHWGKQHIGKYLGDETLMMLFIMKGLEIFTNKVILQMYFKSSSEQEGFLWIRISQQHTNK